MAQADAVVIGAGIVGAFCARALTLAGVGVTVVDQGSVAAGTTGAGEGNVLVSDKELGPELELALLSHRLWRQVIPDLPRDVEWEPKGGLVVATTEDGERSLRELADAQHAAGVVTEAADGAGCRELEPALGACVLGGVFYPQDMQVMPVLAAAAALGDAKKRGARVCTGVTVTAISTDSSGVSGVRTTAGEISTRIVVNAAGTWAADVARLAGARLPIEPRRGFILVTEPMPKLVRHKVYDADYVVNVASGDAGLQLSTVVEGTHSGTVLIGASRERVGFDSRMRYDVLAQLAQRAVRLFPPLGKMRALRAYKGFRPYCPDHLPAIGADPDVGGLWHAAGHEGAGIGLAPATGLLIAQLVTGQPPAIDPAPFAPGRPALQKAST
jgi:glycine/D-amino acid oxidase-like deaminating enzyme